MESLRRVERWALACLLLLAFLPRAIYPVSRPLQWYFRSGEFLEAVLHGDLSETLLSPHPGVTVMWLSGAALWGWYGLQSLAGLNAPAPLETAGYAFSNRVAVGLLPLALVAALGIIWGWHLLRRLFNARVAWAATVLWALDPFHLTNSKALHLDATLSILMMLSALLMLVYLQERKRKSLILSAVVGGLAMLTKVTALFLIPFLGLCLLVDWLSSILGACSGPRRWRWAIRDSLIWLLIAATVCFALWPSLWMQPKATFEMVIEEGIRQKMRSGHGLPRFHRGTVSVDAPGGGFYLDTLLFRTTFLSLPFSLLALAAAVSQRRQKDILLLACFAAFYVVQMTLASRKEPRYLLPAFLALDVLSAWGIVWWSGRAIKAPAVRLGLSGLLLLGQALLVLSKHPYYGTHYNALLGGVRAARQVLPLAQFGEGLDLAGQYIDRQAEAEETIIGTQFLANEMLAQYVRAPVYDLNETGDDADYLVFGVQYAMRGESFARWGALWERSYKFREPVYVVEFEGIPYAWVHQPSAEPLVPETTSIRLGDEIRLVGFRLADGTVSPRDTLLITLYWGATGPVEKDYTVFTHLQNEGGDLIAQQDGVPANADHPTTTWEVGDLIEDPHEIPVPPKTPSGRYALSIGMYDPATGDRLSAFDSEGKPLPHGRIPLATVRVQPLVPRWRSALSGLWLALIIVGMLGFDRKQAPSCQ